jgi:predicted ATP-dependent serine protease
MAKIKQKVKTVRLRDLNFPPEVFIPLKSGKFIDNVISRKGGTMPATITVVVGEPGSGKTTMLVDKLAGIEETNPDKKCLYISSEMNPIDNMELAEELPQLMDIEGFYLADYEDPKSALEDILAEGWDYVIMDSFMDVNESNKYTAFDVIQHITKGGSYAGSTKIKHNTTAMLYLRIDPQTNERYLVYTKNRRGDSHKRLYMYLNEDGLQYNEKKYNDLEKAIKLQKEIDDYNGERESELMVLLKEKEEKEESEWKEVNLGESEGVIDRSHINIANSLNELEQKEEEVVV